MPPETVFDDKWRQKFGANRSWLRSLGIGGPDLGDAMLAGDVDLWGYAEATGQMREM